MRAWLFGGKNASRRAAPDAARKNQKKALGFEALEPRDMLSAAPFHVQLGTAFSGVQLETASTYEYVAPNTDGGGASIVNGTVVPQSAHPTVGLVLSQFSQCTGTLISPRHVLTAAHCIEAGIMQFRLNGVTYTSADEVVHPTDDIAIMVLQQDVNSVTPSEILRNAPVVGEELTIVGYGDHGTTNNPQNGNGLLREGHTTLQFVQSDLIGWVFDGDGESGVSFGDSGGPAFVDRGGDLVVAGVASFVSGNGGHPDFPNIPGTQNWEVRVDAFEEWIDNIIGQSEPPLPMEADMHQELPGPGATVVSYESDGLSRSNGAMNAWAHGAIQVPSDDDAFAFTLDETTDVTITVAATDGRLNPELFLYNSGLTQIGHNNDISATNRNSQIVQTLDAGTYYFTVTPFVNGSIGWYAVAIDLGPNPVGDQHVSSPHPLATDIFPNENGEIAYRDTLENNTDRDVFEFVVGQTSTAQFSVTAANATLNPRLRLFDVGGTEIHDNDDLLSPNETDSYFFETLDPGTYYLMVSSSSSASSGDYVLSIDGALNVAPTTPGDFDEDGDVDGDDFLTWQASFNVNDGGDADDDGDTDGDDFLIWQSNFGTGGAAVLTDGGGGSGGRHVLPPNGGNDFLPYDSRHDDAMRRASLKTKSYSPTSFSYKWSKSDHTILVEPELQTAAKLPKTYLQGNPDNVGVGENESVTSTVNEKHARTRDKVFARNDNWGAKKIQPAVFRSITRGS